MISVDEAKEIVLSHVRTLGVEDVYILSSLGRILAEDIFSDLFIPPFDNSAMDGFALKYEDIKGADSKNPAVLDVAATIKAGDFRDVRIGSGEAAKIMTGAKMPKGADTVVPVEDTEELDGKVKVKKVLAKGSNVRKKGEDVEKGSLVLKKGKNLKPADLGILAALGKEFVPVYKRPRVSVLATGDELLDLGDERGPEKIVNTNTYTLCSQIIEAGCVPIRLGIAKDELDDIKEKLSYGLSSDVIITSGGISVGEFDFVKEALRSLGAKILFWRVAMRPGKPTAFSIIDGRPVFSLPGNPVSSMVTFEQFVKPALFKMLGRKKAPRFKIFAKFIGNFKKKKGLRYFLRVSIKREGDGYLAKLTGEQGSGILTSMVKADGLLVLKEDVSEIKSGDLVEVELFRCDI